MSIRVLLADDQVLVRSGFAMILDASPGVEVVAEADNGLDALRLARSVRPDVCLLDIQMPGLDGLEVTRRLLDPGPTSPSIPLPAAGAVPAVVMVTTFDLDEYVDQALRFGASGFLLKDCGPQLLIEAVRAAASGEAMVSPVITTRLVRHYLDRHPARAATDEPVLSAREEEIVASVARGLTNAEIAEEHHLAVSTVKTHLASVQRKIGARNRVEIAIWAYETSRVR